MISQLEETVRSSEQNQIQGFMSGDLEAIGQLLESYRPRLTNFIRKYDLPPQIDLSDVIQETFLKAITYRKQLRAPNYFSTWIHRIARTTSLDYIRNVNASVKLIARFKDNSSMVTLGYYSDLSVVVEAEDTTNYFTKAMSNLPFQDQAFLRLHFFQGMTYEKMGICLKRSRSSTVKCIRRAINRIISLLNSDNLF